MRATLFLFLLTIIWFSVLSFQIKKISKIEGEIKLIDFDSDFKNSYIVSNINNSDWFYEIDEEKNIELTKNFYKVASVLINKENDVYVLSYDNTEKYVNIWALEKNSEYFKKLTVFATPDWMNSFLDNDGNIFFNTKYGVSMLKRQTNTVVAITNLLFDYFSHHSIDDSGDVYLRVHGHQNWKTVVITNESKNQPAPFAKEVNMEGKEFYPIEIAHGRIYHGNFGKYIYSSSQRAYNDDWFNRCGNDNTYCYNNENNVKATIKKLNNTEEKILHTEYDSVYQILCETNNRLFLTSEKLEKFVNIYFITQDDEVVAIKDVFTNPPINSSQCAYDKNQNVFFGHQKSVTILKNNETESMNIDVPSDESISHVYMDTLDNLWILAKDLYIIRNNTEAAVWLYTLPVGSNPIMKENKLTNEMFITSGNGLYILKKL